MDSSKKLIGAFDMEAQVFNKIGELKEKGYREEDILVVSEADRSVDILREKTAVQFSSDRSGETEHGNYLLYATGSAGGSSAFEADTASAHQARELENYDEDNEERIRLHEEQLQVGKDRVQTGEVNIGKQVVEEEQTIEVPVERDEVYIDRRPVNEEATSGLTGTDAYQDEENIHVPLTEERVDVSKKDVVDEEIVVGKRKVQDVERVRDTVRKEEAEIEENLDEEDPLNGSRRR